MKVASFIPVENDELYDFEIVYADPRVPFSSCATETYTAKQFKSMRNAVASFNRAVPDHGPIKSVRKVVEQ